MESKRRIRMIPEIASATLIATALVALVSAGCVPPASRSSDTTRAPRVKMANASTSPTTNDIRYATYAVGTSGPDGHTQAFYDVAYIARDGHVAIIEGPTGDKNLELTSKNIPDRVKDYLMMSSIIGIIGTRRSFEVGETYDAVMARPEGRPHFTYRAASREKIAGVSGTMLEVSSVRYGSREVDVVISPSFPLPLYVREYSGQRPIQITLVAVRKPGVPQRQAHTQAEMAGGY